MREPSLSQGVEIEPFLPCKLRKWKMITIWSTVLARKWLSPRKRNNKGEEVLMVPENAWYIVDTQIISVDWMTSWLTDWMNEWMNSCQLKSMVFRDDLTLLLAPWEDNKFSRQMALENLDEGSLCVLCRYTLRGCSFLPHKSYTLFRTLTLC